MAKYTEMEQKAIDAARQGKRVVSEQEKVGDVVSPVVSLREFTEEPGTVPPAAPGPIPAEEELEPALPQPKKATVKSGQAISAEDMQQLDAAVFGIKQPEEPKVEAEVKPVEEKKKDSGWGDELAPLNCHRCGWKLKDRQVYEPTQEDMLEFMESVLGGRRFEKEVLLVDGKFKVRFRTLTVTEDDAIIEYLKERTDRGDFRNAVEWTAAHNRARISGMLQEITTGDKTKKYPELNERKANPGVPLAEALPTLIEETLGAWPVPILGLVSQALMTVDGVYNTLMSRAYDRDFWQGRAAE